MNNHIKAQAEERQAEKIRSYFNHTAVLWILVLFVTALSFMWFQGQSLRLDESQSLWQSGHTPIKIINLIAQDVHVPLYHMMLHFWQIIFGSGVAVARRLSLIFFILSIPAMYMFGKSAYDKHIGLFASVLLSISAFMNWYGNETRMYSLLVLVTILNQYFFMKLFTKPDRDSWLGFFITCLFGIYTHYFFFFVLAINGLFYLFNIKLFEKNALKRFILIGIILALAFAPWITYVFMLGKASNAQPSLITPSSVDLFNTFSQFLFGFQTDHINTILVSLWPLTVLLGFIALRRNRGIKPQTVYLIMCFILPNVLAFAVSFIRPVYLSRYLIITIPSMFLLLSYLLSRYPLKLSIALRVVIIAVMLGTLSVEAMSTQTPVKEDYSDAALYLQNHAAPSDVIVVSAPFTVYPIEYYYKGASSIYTLPLWDQYQYGPIPSFNINTLPTQVQSITANHSNVWLLLSYDQGYQKNIYNYFEGHYQKLFGVQLSPGMSLYEYKLRY